VKEYWTEREATSGPRHATCGDTGEGSATYSNEEEGLLSISTAVIASRCATWRFRVTQPSLLVGTQPSLVDDAL
jgi:hypothetical protein